MSTRARVTAFGSAALVVVGGVVLGVLVGGSTGEVLALALAGGGLVVATSLVFLEVGLSEDRERARERACRAPAPEPEDRAQRRLTRMRGRRRRLP